MLVLGINPKKRYNIAEGCIIICLHALVSSSCLQSEVSLHAQMKHMLTFINSSLLVELQSFPCSFLIVWPVQCFYMSHQKATTGREVLSAAG